MADSDVARLLLEYVHKPPRAALTADDARNLRQFVIQDKTFRKLKDAVRIEAWARAVPSLNADASSESFAVNFAEQQGFRRGMLHAIDRLEEILEDLINDD